ncbi:hypothetical protein HNV11_06705 [Spirosoma taeanense]|uniref:Uncharacterized protein n=1 Tax=Spirosoma taeanense TaxID=2735870 RepID=A0A6M5Y796_9BACT|nr:hypothetical protein [Spirosoma taeanense]QJW89101.1 hypothetical protein HNV11_06705 [Spirosoma taeanense]
MNGEKLYNLIDKQVEKSVFLFAADEGVYGLWEFVQEVNFEFLTIAEKYAIAYDLLKELLLDELLILEEFTSTDLTQKVKNIEVTELESILSRPFSWYPSGTPTYSVSITQRGIDYLEKLSELERQNLSNGFLEVLNRGSFPSTGCTSRKRVCSPTSADCAYADTHKNA